MLWQSDQRATFLKKKGTFLSYQGYIAEKKSLGRGLTGGFFVGVDPDTYVSKDDITQRAKKNNLDYIQWETYSLTSSPTSSIALTPGAYKSILPSHTAYIDLTQGLDKIWKSCKHKGRYGVNYARAHDVSIRFSHTYDDLIIFYKLLEETAHRDNFFVNPFDHYDALLTSTDSTLVLAYHHNTIIAGAMLITDHHITRYYYGASTSGPQKNLMASYLVQRESIVYAHNRGSHIYDFLGVAPPDDPTHPLVGVGTFKQKFGPQIVACSHAYHRHRTRLSRLLAHLKILKKGIKKIFISSTS